MMNYLDSNSLLFLCQNSSLELDIWNLDRYVAGEINTWTVVQMDRWKLDRCQHYRCDLDRCLSDRYELDTGL